MCRLRRIFMCHEFYEIFQFWKNANTAKRQSKLIAMYQNSQYKMSDYADLPFFPKHETTLIDDDNIRIIWFETRFSQTDYNFRGVSSPSNACTLIAILMASYCRREQVLINHPRKFLNVKLIYILAHSILDGNRIHENLRTRGSLDDFNLTVPEAIKFAGERASGIVEWKSLIYMESLFKTLHHNIGTTWSEWLKNKPYKHPSTDLYVILIADNRSVLFIIQKESKTVTLVDSHQHSDTKGALIAVCGLDRMTALCMWFNHVVNKCFRCDPELYELSFLYFEK